MKIQRLFQAAERSIEKNMELTSKQRAQLRGLANSIDTILIVGKDGIGDNLVKQANDALEARELIKGRVLENSLMSAREAAVALAPLTRSEVVQVIGTKFVSVITCCFPNGAVLPARGECPGTIAFVPMGNDGFGYNPVFFVPEKKKTFAQMTLEERSSISHRGKAMREFYGKLEEYLKK